MYRVQGENEMTYIRKILIVFYLLPGISLAQIVSKVDENTGLKSWKLIQAGLELQLVQRSPDQTRGFYQGRGFTKQVCISNHSKKYGLTENRGGYFNFA